MLDEICECAWAKINLGLRVLPPREDGFHNIESVFHTVNLCDRLFVSVQEGCGECSVHSDECALPVENTLSMAYKAFCRVTGINARSIDVRLEKNIPCGGGLGGGSSDAAALIRVLEKIQGVSLGVEALDDIASVVGSDVFFFCHGFGDGGFAAVVSGRGEIVRKIPYRSDLYIALVFPNVCSSTREAYALVDGMLSCDDMLSYPAFSGLEEMYSLSPAKWSFVNSFTAPLCARYEKISCALEIVKRSGALFSDMSGSGSTVFGVYGSERDAKNALSFIESEGFHCVNAY